MAGSSPRPRALRPPQPLRPPRIEPRLLPLLVPIFVLGFLSILHIISLARLSELECEKRRLDRLMLAQKSRTIQLMREHQALTAQARLQAYAQRKGMVPPPPLRELRLGVLPPPRKYWETPEAPAPERFIDGLELGQAQATGPGG